MQKLVKITSDNKIAVLIREYIDGQDLDSLFSTTQLSHEEWDHLLGSLGTVLGQIHRVKFPTFGLIKDWKIVGSMNRSAPAAVKWIDFYDDMMAGAETFLGSLADKKIGTLTNKDLNVIMITGYHRATAEAISKQLGIQGRAITGQELMTIQNLE